MAKRKFNPEEYETVAERLVRFKMDHPNFRMDSQIERVQPVEVIPAEYSDDMRASRSYKPAQRVQCFQWVIKVSLWLDAADEHPVATGYSEETDGLSGANESAALENAETSALGRALANAGYAGSRRVTREEMRKTITYQDVKDRIPEVADKAALSALWQDAANAGVAQKLRAQFTERAKELAEAK